MTNVRSSLRLSVACLLASSVAAAASDPYDATRARPLFAPSRRPAAVARAVAPPIVAAPARPPAPPPNVVLSGIILGQGTGMALIRRPADAAATRVVVGGTVDGWTIAEIQPRAIVLRLDDRSVTIVLPDPTR